MKFVPDLKKLSALTAKIKRLKMDIGFVPTMGALHEGHFSLIRKARKENDLVVVSIFVNPSQFGPNEDFNKYPRVFNYDLKSCIKEKVDAIFYPSVKEMYPEDYKTFVTVSDLGDCLCGKFRPVHFRGVATIVAKLFNIIAPDNAYFGQKDAQQCVIIKRLASDFNFPVVIKILPTIREADGLAMSSRNKYLNLNERNNAVVLFHALNLAKDLIKAGESDAKRIINCMKRLIESLRIAKVEYIDIVDLEDLKPLKSISGKCLIALAVRIGKTRLIDNIIAGGY